MCNFMVSKLFYVVVFANLIFNLNDAKAIKRYKRRNEDLLNNLNNTFATLMNIMMDPSDNSQLSKEQFFSTDQLQSADLQELLSNNSMFNQQLSSFENFNNGMASSIQANARQMPSYDPSSFSSSYFSNNQNGKKDFSNNYGNQIIQQQNSYLTQDQLANAPTYLDNNPSLNQAEMNSNDNAITNLIIDDNFNQLNHNNLLETSGSLKINNPLASKPTNNYLSNYSDLSKYGKIKVSDFQMNSADLPSSGTNEFKKKPTQMPITSNTVPLKYNFNDDKKNSNSFRSFSPDFDADFEQFKISNSLSNAPKLDQNQNYFDKTKTRDPIKTTTTYETTQAFHNYNQQNGLNTNTLSVPSNSLQTSLPQNNNNNHQVTGDQRITLGSIQGTPNLNANKFNLLNPNIMVSNNDAQYSSIPNEIQPFLVFNQNDKNVFSEIPAQLPAQKGYHTSIANYNSGHSSMNSYGGGHSIPMSYGGGHNGHSSGYSIPMHSMNYGHGNSYMPAMSYSGHNGYSGSYMPMSYSAGHGHSSYSIPIMHSPQMSYNIKANVNAKVIPSMQTSYGGSHGGYSSGYSGSYMPMPIIHSSTTSYGGHGGGYYKNLPTTTSIKTI